MPHPAASYRHHPGRRRAHVTRKQLAILTAVANGSTNAAAARQLGISRNTVLGQLQATYRKLGAVDRTHAVALAMARGLIRPEDIHPAEEPTKPGTPPAHVGGNAEDCPACDLLPPGSIPYPWICPGPKGGAR